MTPVFTINFRREAYEREIARVRGRVIALGVWVTYFGLMAIILGLYGLNAAAFARRTGMLEHQARRAREMQGHTRPWTLGTEEVGAMTQRTRSMTQHWRQLRRIGELLPSNARLVSLTYNAENVSGAAPRKLVLAGTLRPLPSQDRMRGVVSLVSTLSSDSVFTRAFRNVKLTSTTVSEGNGAVEFTIECQ